MWFRYRQDLNDGELVNRQRLVWGCVTPQTRPTIRDIIESGCILREGHQVEFQSYEFNNNQNQLIRELSEKMRFVSYFLIGLGVLVTILGLVLIANGGGLGNIIQGIVQIFIGFWTNKAASAFKQIVDTQGNDMENLMSALSELRKLYTLQYWLYIVALIFVALGIVLGIAFTVGR